MNGSDHPFNFEDTSAKQTAHSNLSFYVISKVKTEVDKCSLDYICSIKDTMTVTICPVKKKLKSDRRSDFKFHYCQSFKIGAIEWENLPTATIQQVFFYNTA